MSINSFVYRPAALGKDETRIAKLWHDVYHESHGDLVPAELLKFRTLESFSIRVAETSFINETTLAIRIQDQSEDAPDHVVGFITTRVKDCEIHQLFVDKEVRGLGVARELMSRAENYFKSFYNNNHISHTANISDTCNEKTILNEQSYTHEMTLNLYASVGNFSAQKFYKKNGWKVVKEEQFQAEIIVFDKDVGNKACESTEDYQTRHFPLPCYRFEKKLTW